jgi:hypothetical protein
MLAAWVKCRKCKAERYKQDAYRSWHNVDCFETILGPFDLSVTWIKNWWICPACAKKANLWEGARFHDIDGFTYFLSWKFPFIKRG